MMGDTRGKFESKPINIKPGISRSVILGPLLRPQYRIPGQQHGKKNSLKMTGKDSSIIPYLFLGIKQQKLLPIAS